MRRILWHALLILPVSVTAQQPQAAPAAQQPQAAVVPQAITVGDVFHAAVRVDLPPGASVVAPDSINLPADLELAGRREIRVDSTADGRRATVLYPLTAWRPGEYVLPPLAIGITGDGVDAAWRVSLPAFEVASVLPADTAGVEPQPAKDVLGANRLWWPLLLALLLLALAAAAFYLWWRGRRRDEEYAAEPMPVVLPREAALRRLHALQAAGLVERGEMKAFYGELAEIVRRYTATINPDWGVDLTTSELAARMGDATAARTPAAPTEGAADVLGVLGGADLIKFARGTASSADAWRDLDIVRAWVERTSRPPVEPDGGGTGSEERRVA